MIKEVDIEETNYLDEFEHEMEEYEANKKNGLTAGHVFEAIGTMKDPEAEGIVSI